MRRNDRAQDRDFALSLIDRCTHGVMALTTDEAVPYCLPLSFVRVGDELYFHCAREGHKLDAIARCPKASFCVVEQDQVEPLKYTTLFRSVIAFGTIRVLKDEGEMYTAVEALALKYAPMDTQSHREEFIQKDWAPLCVLEMTIDHLTGKEAIELVRARQK